MGAVGEPGAVTDGAGRLQGLEDVYVADASLMPEIPRANTNLTCMVLGRRVAEHLIARAALA